MRRLDGGGPIQRAIAPGTEPRAYSPDGRILLVHGLLDKAGPSQRDRMTLWDPATGSLVNPLDGVQDSLSFVSSDRLVAVWHGQPGVYDYRAEKMVVSAAGDTIGAEPDLGGNRLLSWYHDGNHRFFDLATGDQVGPELPMSSFTRDASFTADGRHVALFDLEEGVTVFDAITGETVAGPISGLASTAISRDGLLVASTRTGDLSFRDAVTLEPRGLSLPAGAGLSNASVELSADGSLLVASAPGQTQLFDVASRTPLGGSIETTGSAALDPHGKQLAVATTTGVAVWDLDPARWVEAACQLAGRNLTRDEWTTYIGDLAPYHETCPLPV
jgi:WD40 repeat protein